MPVEEFNWKGTPPLNTSISTSSRLPARDSPISHNHPIFHNDDSDGVNDSYHGGRSNSNDRNKVINADENQKNNATDIVRELLTRSSMRPSRIPERIGADGELQRESAMKSKVKDYSAMREYYDDDPDDDNHNHVGHDKNQLDKSNGSITKNKYKNKNSSNSSNSSDSNSNNDGDDEYDDRANAESIAEKTRALMRIRNGADPSSQQRHSLTEPIGMTRSRSASSNDKDVFADTSTVGHNYNADSKSNKHKNDKMGNNKSKSKCRECAKFQRERDEAFLTCRYQSEDIDSLVETVSKLTKAGSSEDGTGSDRQFCKRCDEVIRERDEALLTCKYQSEDIDSLMDTVTKLTRNAEENKAIRAEVSSLKAELSSCHAVLRGKGEECDIILSELRVIKGQLRKEEEARRNAEADAIRLAGTVATLEAAVAGTVTTVPGDPLASRYLGVTAENMGKIDNIINNNNSNKNRNNSSSMHSTISSKAKTRRSPQHTATANATLSTERTQTPIIPRGKKKYDGGEDRLDAKKKIGIPSHNRHDDDANNNGNNNNNNNNNNNRNNYDDFNGNVDSAPSDTASESIASTVSYSSSSRSNSSYSSWVPASSSNVKTRRGRRKSTDASSNRSRRRSMSTSSRQLERKNLVEGEKEKRNHVRKTMNSSKGPKKDRKGKKEWKERRNSSKKDKEKTTEKKKSKLKKSREKKMGKKKGTETHRDDLGWKAPPDYNDPQSISSSSSSSSFHPSHPHRINMRDPEHQQHQPQRGHLGHGPPGGEMLLSRVEASLATKIRENGEHINYQHNNNYQRPYPQQPYPQQQPANAYVQSPGRQGFVGGNPARDRSMPDMGSFIGSGQNVNVNHMNDAIAGSTMDRLASWDNPYNSYSRRSPSPSPPPRPRLSLGGGTGAINAAAEDWHAAFKRGKVQKLKGQQRF